MSVETEIEKAEKELAKLEDMESKDSVILEDGKALIHNNRVEDKDDAITSIKRVEKSLEEAIEESYKFAVAADNPKGYDAMAKLVKEFGTLQKIKMDIHNDSVNLDNIDPYKENDQPNNNQTIPTNIQEIINRVNQNSLEKDDDE